MMKKDLYVDCLRGMSSDMFVASLIGCFEDKDAILQKLQDKISNDMVLSADSAKSYERQGLTFKAVDKNYRAHLSSDTHHHAHSSLKDVHGFIDSSKFEDSIKNSAKEVYDIIANAEAQVHGATPDSVHFHEVGQKRAIACILCACALIEYLAPGKIVFSAINTGYGKVLCAHGEVDVPAPATAAIIKDLPHFYLQNLGGELCTPTGAALARHFATQFADRDCFLLPTDRAGRIGVGIGQKDIGIANGVISVVVNDV